MNKQVRVVYRIKITYLEPKMETGESKRHQWGAMKIKYAINEVVFTTTHLCHSVINLHRSDPFAQTLSCRGSLGNFCRVKVGVGHILTTDFVHDWCLPQSNISIIYHERMTWSYHI